MFLQSRRAQSDVSAPLVVCQCCCFDCVLERVHVLCLVLPYRTFTLLRGLTPTLPEIVSRSRVHSLDRSVSTRFLRTSLIPGKDNSPNGFASTSASSAPSFSPTASVYGLFPILRSTGFPLYSWHIGELEFVTLLLHRSPFVATPAGPADVQSLNKIFHPITATLLLQSTKSSLGP